MKTYSAKPGEVERKWYIVDAKGQPLGRLASRVAAVLRGKHKPQYTPHVDTGDFVVVINAEQVHLSGRKPEQKIYYRHTRHPGGLKETKAKDLRRTRPERMIELAVWGMLPHHRLGRRMIRKLKVYRGTDHPHQAQQPQPLAL